MVTPLAVSDTALQPVAETQPFEPLTVDPQFARGRCVVVMGVSACGKSSVAKALREMLPAWEFKDADPFHPPENWAKIVAGNKLTDPERAVFVGRLVAFLTEQRELGANTILSWSALKLEHRDLVRQIIPTAKFVYLSIDFETAYARSVARKAKDAGEPGPGIVESQFQALEVPSETEALHLRAVDPLIANTFKVVRSYVETRFVLAEEVGIGRR